MTFDTGPPLCYPVSHSATGARPEFFMSRDAALELAFAMPIDSPAEIAVGSLLVAWRDVTVEWFTDADTTFVVLRSPAESHEQLRRAVMSADPAVLEVSP